MQRSANHGSSRWPRTKRASLVQGKLVSRRGSFCACAMRMGKDGNSKAVAYDIAVKRWDNDVHVSA